MKHQHKRRWVGHPTLSVMLGAAWLLLQQSLALPQLITATVLGLGIPWLMDSFIGAAVHPRNWGTVVRLSLVVVWDIIMSNITVARIVLTPGSNPQPAWVPVPLDIQHPTAITLLAAIITMTPGTVSCVVDEKRHEVLVHALDCDDVPALVADIKARYEAPLKEIFG